MRALRLGGASCASCCASWWPWANGFKPQGENMRRNKMLTEFSEAAGDRVSGTGNKLWGQGGHGRKKAMTQTQNLSPRTVQNIFKICVGVSFRWTGARRLLRRHWVQMEGAVDAATNWSVAFTPLFIDLKVLKLVRGFIRFRREEACKRRIPLPKKLQSLPRTS